MQAYTFELELQVAQLKTENAELRMEQEVQVSSKNKLKTKINHIYSSKTKMITQLRTPLPDSLPN